jgi:hypothetical protein
MNVYKVLVRDGIHFSCKTCPQWYSYEIVCYTSHHAIDREEVTKHLDFGLTRSEPWKTQNNGSK